MNQPRDKVREIIGKLLAAESGGEAIADQRVISRHPTLSNELPDALQSLQAIRSAEIQSQAAGSIDQPLKLLSEEELAAPIETNEIADNSELSPAMGRDWIAGYELLEQIGQGGQATVYRAKKVSTGGTVAIKILPGGFFATSRARARFEREAQALVRVTHPNIVPVYDKGRTRDGSPFIVMQYVEGLQLNTFLAGETDSVRIATLFNKICLAVGELHRCGIIHRDLKPSNVMVDRYGEPHVLDFGLARVDDMQGVTDTGQVLGSIPWASPEQAAGRLDEVDERSDIYCIGVMLAFILDGKVPYPLSVSPMETARHICRTPAMVGQGRKVGPLDGIALKCLAKNPAQRYSSAAELAQEFARIAAGEKPLFVKGHPRISRRLLLLALAISVLAVGITAVARNKLKFIETVQADQLPPQTETVIPLPQYTNSLGMRFVRVPAGSFTMGSPPQERGSNYAEQQRPVRIAEPFYLAVTETTEDIYRHVMNSISSAAGIKDANLPARGVSYKDALKFCEQLAREDGHQYRLPSEAEWEYACRAASDTKVISSGKLRTMAWYADNSGGVPHPVASLAPNRWGLYDMLGGVSEWCSGTVEHNLTPADGGFEFGITRGGAFDLPADWCRSAARRTVSRTATVSDVGFRVVLER